MKHYCFLIFFLVFTDQIKATVKTFVNNSKKEFFIRIYFDEQKITGVQLLPGEIKDVFLEGKIISKITVQDEKQKSKPLSSMTRNALKKDEYPINESMIFIIQQDNSIKMFPGGKSNRDQALLKIDEYYTKNAQLPSIDLTIATKKTNDAWTMQEVCYSIKTTTGILDSIKSFF
jgi:hypothetical protein